MAKGTPYPFTALHTGEEYTYKGLTDAEFMELVPRLVKAKSNYKHRLGLLFDVVPNVDKREVVVRIVENPNPKPKAQKFTARKAAKRPYQARISLIERRVRSFYRDAFVAAVGFGAGTDAHGSAKAASEVFRKQLQEWAEQDANNQPKE